MKKKLVSVLLTVAMVAAMSVGCSQPEVTETQETTEETTEEVGGEKVVTFNIGMEPTTLDPGLNAGTEGSLVLSHMYDGLLKEQDGQYVEAAAESYEVSEDGKVYTFTLRDANWSDGQPVTAKDFEFAWNRALDPVVASPYAWIFESGAIESFKAVDDKTFEVTLTYPNSIFLTLLGNTTFMPLREDVIDYETGAWALDPEKIVTNGAFTMTEYTAGDRLILEKNDEYYDAENVHLDELVGLMIVDQTTALTAYEAGELDAIYLIPPAEKQRLLTEDPNFIVQPNNALNYYAFNMQEAPFDDVRVRQAFQYAIDRTSIANDVIKGGVVPAHSMVPSVIMEDDGDVFNEVDSDFGIPSDLSKVDEAKALMAEAGYPDGEGFPEVELLYNTSEENKAVAETLQQQWKDNLGVTVNLVNMESSVFHKTRVAGDFQITKGGWGGDYNNPLTHLELYVPGNDFNYSEFANDDYTRLIEEAKMSSGQESFDKYHQAEKILMDSYAYMPVTYSVFTCLIDQDKITDFDITFGGYYSFVNADIVE